MFRIQPIVEEQIGKYLVALEKIIRNNISCIFIDNEYVYIDGNNKIYKKIIKNIL